MLVRDYLRASTVEQDATRAREQVERFAEERGLHSPPGTLKTRAAPPLLAAVARKDNEDRRRRQAQGQARAKAAGVYKGRPENTARNAGIGQMQASGSSWSTILDATGCSRATIAKIAKRAAA